MRKRLFESCRDADDVAVAMRPQRHFLGVSPDCAFKFEGLRRGSVIKFERLHGDDNVASEKISDSIICSFCLFQECIPCMYGYAYAMYPISLIMLIGHTDVHVKIGE